MLKRLQRKLFLTLEVAHPDNRFSHIFDYFFVGLILLNVIVVCLETVDSIQAQYRILFYRFEFFSIVFFTVEYFLRLWCCTISHKYRHPVWGRIRYIFSPLALMDLIVVLPFYLSVPITDLRFARSLRLFQFLRFLKLTRYFKSLKMLGKVLVNRQEELISTVISVVVLLLFSGSLIYFAEHEAQPEQFPHIPAAMWWAVVTLTTVGYGDVYPVTIMGRILGGIVALLGVGIVALPAGIVATSFAEVLEKKKEKQQQLQVCPHCGKPIHQKPKNKQKENQ
ncbi:MAG: ion transporter [Microcoleaceae cyanobacterium]